MQPFQWENLWRNQGKSTQVKGIIWYQRESVGKVQPNHIFEAKVGGWQCATAKSE